jgi:mannose-1-phosphate guanylyltransferase/phosphomannomutase
MPWRDAERIKAVVMAGGSGSRLRPLTIGRPKPMVPIVNKPVMAHIRDLLQRHDIRDMVCTLQYLPDVIQDYFGDGKDRGMRIVYSVEEVPLGTAGSVKNAQQYLDDTFLVISGDAIADFDLRAIVEFHRQKKARATLVLYHVPNPLEYGVIVTNDEGRIVEFQEKPGWGEVMSDTVNTGIYVLEPEVLDYLEPGVPFDFAKDLFPMMLERGDPIYGYIAGAYWCDIGTIQEYMRATSDILHGRVNLPEEMGQHIGGGVWVEEDVEIAPDAELYGPVFLGRGVKVKGGVIIHGPSVIRNYVVIDNRTQIERSVIWRNSYIGEGTEIRGAIVGRQCNVKTGAVLYEGVVVGDNTIIGAGAILYSDVKIWPGKEIETGSMVKSSIIWGSQGRKVLFSRYGVTGLVNVDLTPEIAARLGAAFAASLPKGSTAVINRDPHRSPRMIKRAIISGIPSAGVNVHDTQSMPIPVARYYTRISGAVGGVHVRLSPYDNRVVDVRFFDSNGLNLSKSAERNIERVFFREDFRRVYLDEIGAIAYAPEVIQRYVAGFLKVIDVPAVRAARFNLVVDYASAPSALVLPSILSELGCNVTALNANVDESRMSIPREEFQRALEQLGIITSALGSDLGVRLDVGGERIFVVDTRGKQLPGVTLSAALAVLALRAHGGGSIAVPLTASRIFEQLAEQHGGSVLRTRADVAELMLAATRKGVIMAADGLGNFAFPEFQPAIDGLMAIARLLEFLATQKTRLSDVVDALPPYHLAQRQVPCAWEQKGMVMRHLNEQYRDRKEKQVDGLRIRLENDDWVLVLPDPDEPVVDIYAESDSDDQAGELADHYRHVVEELLS